MLLQLAIFIALALVIWGTTRLFSLLFRIVAGLFGSFILVHWLTFSPRNIWTLIYELAGLTIILFLVAAATGGLRRRSRW